MFYWIAVPHWEPDSFTTILGNFYSLLDIVDYIVSPTQFKISHDDLFKAFLVPIVGCNYGFRNIHWKGVMSAFLVLLFFSSSRNSYSNNEAKEKEWEMVNVSELHWYS